jgi:hypothetical protein
MTSYGISITLDDVEIQTLQKALAHYLDASSREANESGDEDEEAAVSPFALEIRYIRLKLRKGQKAANGLAFGFGEVDREVIKKSLASYLELCEREIANGVIEPFTSDRALVKKISARLLDEFWRAVLEAEAEWVARGKYDT